MYAVVDIAGQQFQVHEGDVVRVPHLPLEAGTPHTLEDVLLLRTDENTMVGDPHVAGASVQATVVSHGRADKIVVFKMKRRKNYRRRNGHRQGFTELRIDGIAVPN